MKHGVAIFVATLAVGAALGAIGSRIVAAQQGSESRTYHPGTECIYVLEGALNLEEGGTSVQLKAADAHCVPPRTVLVPRNANSTAPYKSLVVMIAPKGQPLAVPVKD